MTSLYIDLFFLKCLIFLCVSFCVCMHVCVHVYFGPHISVLGVYSWLGAYGLLLLVLEYYAMLDDWTGLSWLHSICSSHLSYLCGPEARFFFRHFSSVLSCLWTYCYILLHFGRFVLFLFGVISIRSQGLFLASRSAQEWLLGVLRIELVLATG